jgi:hypothetical protein
MTPSRLDVRGATGLAAEADVAQDGLDLGFGREDREAEAGGEGAVADDAVAGDFGHDGVIHDGFAEGFGAEHGGAHDGVVGDHRAVVGEGGGACGGEGFEVGDFLALPPARDAGGGEDAHGEGVLDLLAEPFGGVAGGKGVGHGDDAGEAACGGSLGAGAAGLGEGVAGVAEMDVDVPEAGRGDETRGVEAGQARGVGAGGEDAPFADGEVGGGVGAAGGIDDPHVREDKVCHDGG